MRRENELLTGEWAVLALLCEAPAHGYAVAAAMDPKGEIGRIWSLSQALTYRAIDVLRERGLVQVLGTVPGEGGPRRIEHDATPAARALVSDWLTTPEENIRDLRSRLLLKMTFRQRAGLALEPLLAAQHEVLTTKAEALGKRAEIGDLTDRWRATMANAALEFVDQARAREAGPSRRKARL